MESTSASPLLLTGDVARLLGVSSETVRFWEQTGRLHATRTEGGTRLFDRSDVERLARERADSTSQAASTKVSVGAHS
jgi:excisionase family DNA binding protein